MDVLGFSADMVDSVSLDVRDQASLNVQLVRVHGPPDVSSLP